MALKDGLISYFELEETSGEIIDSHGDNDGENNHADRGEDGKIGNCFYLDGVNDYLDWENIDVLPEDDDFSFSIWVKVPSSLGSGEETVILSQRSNNNFMLYANTDLGSANGNLRLWVDEEVLVGSDIRDDTWHHIVLTCEKTNGDYDYVLYLDNEVDATGTSSNAITDGQMLIGERGGSYDYRFEGYMDEIGVFEVTLSSSDVSELWNDGDGLRYGAIAGIDKNITSISSNIEVKDVTPIIPIEISISSISASIETKDVTAILPIVIDATKLELDSDVKDVETITPQNIEIEAEAFEIKTDVKKVGMEISFIQKVGTGPKGTRYLKTDWPHKTGLKAGFQKQKGRRIGLKPDKSIVRKKEKEGL